ncbi:hypothetical protein ALC62_12271 [Cyphomyrmex costatus]|uniref:Uncharacterized protein n=1 Tax=Cyphomyrmex costatus TaxID=456900 RepID=A0A151IBL3_9HYME|nr:hypothetical protein ALC62_12271 [Cyphomyrmex costatus]
MGKSSHKSRKRKRSLSRDRLAGIENKMSRLIDILSRSEVRSPSGPSQASSSEAVLASLARQEGLTDPKLSEEIVDEEDDTLLNHPKQVTIDESSLNVLPASDCDTDSLAKQLFGPDLAGEETSQWNELVSRNWRDLTRKGIAADQREFLLKKFTPPEALSFLRAPTLNQECRVPLKITRSSRGTSTRAKIRVKQA